MLSNIIRDRRISPVRVSEEIKVNATAYCNFLTKDLHLYLDDLALLLLRNVVFMHDNKLSHSARYTQTLLGFVGTQGERLMVWAPTSLGLNPIQTLWSLSGQDFYADGRQFTLKDI